MSALDVGHAHSYLHRYSTAQHSRHSRGGASIGVAEALAAEEDLVRSSKERSSANDEACDDSTHMEESTEHKNVPQHHSAMHRYGTNSQSYAEVKKASGGVGGVVSGGEVAVGGRTVAKFASMYGGVTAAAKRRAAVSSFREDPGRMAASTSEKTTAMELSSPPQGVVGRWRKGMSMKNSDEVGDHNNTAFLGSLSRERTDWSSSSINTAVATSFSSEGGSTTDLYPPGTEMVTSACNALSMHPPLTTSNNDNNACKSNNEYHGDIDRLKIRSRSYRGGYGENAPRPKKIPDENENISRSTTTECIQKRKQVSHKDTNDPSPTLHPKAKIQPQIQLQPQPTIRYYRIVYRGVVGLLSKPDIKSPKSGAYVSYGEIIGTRNYGHSATQPSNSSFSPQLSTAYSGSVYSLNSCSLSSLDARTNAADAAAAAVTLPLGPPPTLPHVHPNSQNHRHELQSIEEDIVVIQVDEVLTGGYAADAVRNGIIDDDEKDASVQDGKGEETESQLENNGDKTRDTPRRSNYFQQQNRLPRTIVSNTPGSITLDKKMKTVSSSGYTSFGNPSPYHLSPTSPSHSHKEVIDIENDGLEKDTQDHRSSHHGYLFLRRGDVVVAEPISVPLPICQHGAFFYKVCSSVPVPILTGPCLNAPRTRAMALPGTVHEVSLRISGVEDSDENDKGGGVIFLRLSHRRGWIPDRKTSGGRKGWSMKGGRRSIVMKEIIGGDDISRGGGSSCCSETIISTSTSVTSSSIATPAGLVRRRRPRRRRRERDDGLSNAGTKIEDGGTSNAPVASLQRGEKTAEHSDASGKIDPMSRRGAHDPIKSPESNISILTNDSSFNRGSVQDLDESVISQQSYRHRSDRSGANSGARDIVSLSTSFDKHNAQDVSVSSPTYFLMRVTAPQGMKILDAPHFQVNRLIHGKCGSTSKVDKGISKVSQLPPKPHHSIFHTMAGSLTTESSSDVQPPRTRILPRGTLFEATRRQESAGVYTPGSGLIKLADNSGWAIVPHKEDLDRQYRNYNGGVAGVKEGEATRAYEELGNSIAVPAASPVWLRITSRSGVLVSCTPPLPPTHGFGDENNECNGQLSPSSSMEGSVVSPLGGSEVASSIGSNFFDAVFRTPRKLDGRQIPQRGAVGSSEKKRTDEKQQQKTLSQSMARPVIACGLCVAVDPWEVTEKITQGFARLCGGQGWIPRQPSFAVEVERPDVRQGSFWFRVQSTRGMKVRQGPSKRANPITSDDNVYFRFECGEFLRASEVITVFSPPDHSQHPGQDSIVAEGGSNKHTSECFAKLYRRKHGSQPNEQPRFPSLTNLTAPGEWVQVHSNEKLYLEECINPPSIERHHQGWRYTSIFESGAQVRKGPSFLADKCEKVLEAGESVLINERVTAHGEGVTWLRLKDGSGWVHDVNESNEVIMIVHSFRHRGKSGSKTTRSRIGEKFDGEINEASYNSIIARLFQNDGTMLDDKAS